MLTNHDDLGSYTCHARLRNKDITSEEINLAVKEKTRSQLHPVNINILGSYHILYQYQFHFYFIWIGFTFCQNF